MGVLQRFGDIMSANINALLDKCEDPVKMIDQYMRQAKEDQAAVKKETASIMAEEANAKRNLDKVKGEKAQYDTAVRNAIAQGDDEGAKKLLERSNALGLEVQKAQQVYDIAAKNAENMRAMYDKLSSDIVLLEQRRANVKAQASMANAQERINKTSQRFGNNRVGDAFSRMEERTARRLDEATAAAQLDAMTTQDSTADLKDKYLAGGNSSLDDQLAAIKAEMGV